MKIKILSTGLMLLWGASAGAAVINFDDNVLGADAFFDPQADVTWSSGGADFDHSWNETFDCCWGGFTYSNRTDTTTAGFLNDRSAITGDGVGAGQDNYAIGTTGSAVPELRFGGAKTVLGAFFTNATYSYLAMANGDDGNVPAFVKGPFGADDFFRLTVTGIDGAGAALSSLDFLLADGANVLDDWAWFDLTGLGEVNGLRFSLDSSDAGAFGINTPGYFAVDSINVVPVPAAVWLFVSALGLLGLRRRRVR
jgi:hypothetical protein